MAKVQLFDNRPGYFEFECPGCGCLHYVNTNPQYGAHWQFNGNIDRPTFSPSILVGAHKVAAGSNELRCHSFIKDGMIQFLNDCEHNLKGQTVELLEI